ncbi:MAG: prepilin-type N-terminal cleavage/methylation domain-containing protein [Clostridia bacterium]|nr:prepilin-type N-terminal cleavage/methylation domain-containing protein [Clostridia bacterium]
MIKNKSFTLIELLVVIVIIGILAGVIIVSTSSSISKANIAKVKVFENSIQNELGANMVSRWKLDEISGVTTPDAWGSNIGTLGDGVTASTYPALKSESECITGKCMSFDGVDDYVNLSKNIMGTSSVFTVSHWIKLSSNQVGKTIFSNGNGRWVTGIGDLSAGLGNNYIKFYLAGVTFYSTYALNVDSWYLITCLYDNSKGKIYINGKLDNSIDRTFVSINDKINMIGRLTDGGQNFNGLIDDVRIYNAALSTSQIEQEYVAGLNSLLANNNISKEEYDQRLNNLAYDKE